MRKIWLVVKREFLTRVRTKGFIISTVALPLFTIAIFLVPVFMARRQADRSLKIAILDDAGGLAAGIAQGLDRKLPNGQPAFQIVRTLDKPRREEGEKLRQQLRDQVSRGELDGFLVVPEEVIAGKPATFHTKNTSDLTLAGSLRRAVSDAAVTARLQARGIKLENVTELVRGVDVTLVKVTKGGEIEEKGQTFLTAMIMVMVLYMTLLVYGLMTLRSVLEEKTTRIVEVLVSSLRPFQLLTGKLLGVAAVGFTQYLIWTISGALLVSYGASVAAAFSPGSSLPQIQFPLSMLVYLVVFYLAGYFLYAALYAAAGAMVSSDEEAQYVQLPMTLMIVVAFMLFGVIMHNPNSTLSIVLSLIPFFAPILMVMRIAIQTPPFWQIALSIGLMFLTTLGVLHVTANIYRVGILMYGKRQSVVELLRRLR